MSKYIFGKEVTKEEVYSVSVHDRESSDNRVVMEKQMGETMDEIAAAKDSVVLTYEEETDVLVNNLGCDFAYRQLCEEDRSLYDAILDILLRAQESAPVPSKDPKQLDFVFNCVMLDHPELFYVNGYTYTKYTVRQTIQSIDFMGSYTMDEVQIRDYQRKIVEKCNEILANAPDSSTYDKVKYFYEYIIRNTEYEQDSFQNQNIVSVFLYGKSVCQGYAKAMQFLSIVSGIDCFLVTGTVNHGEGHAWNLISIDGDYYQMDVTWGDASYSSSDDTGSVAVPEINYDYLCVSTPLIERSHVINSIVEIPTCMHMKYNYYVQEGAYFERVDEEQLRKLFETGYQEGRQFVTIKCSDDQVYDEMEAYLLEKTFIFEYIQGNPDQIVYSLNELQTSMSFWLNPSGSQRK